MAQKRPLFAPPGSAQQVNVAAQHTWRAPKNTTAAAGCCPITFLGTWGTAFLKRASWAKSTLPHCQAWQQPNDRTACELVGSLERLFWCGAGVIVPATLTLLSLGQEFCAKPRSRRATALTKRLPCALNALPNPLTVLNVQFSFALFEKVRGLHTARFYWSLHARCHFTMRTVNEGNPSPRGATAATHEV